MSLVMERIHHAIFVETKRSQVEIHDTFSQCGKIQGIHPWEVHPDRGELSCFVEFYEQGSVKRARALQVPDVQVHVVAFSPQLISHFNAVAPPPVHPSPYKVKQETREYDRVLHAFPKRRPFDTRSGKRVTERRARARAYQNNAAAFLSPSSSSAHTDADSSFNASYHHSSDFAARVESNKENDAKLQPWSNERPTIMPLSDNASHDSLNVLSLVSHAVPQSGIPFGNSVPPAVQHPLPPSYSSHCFPSTLIQPAAPAVPFNASDAKAPAASPSIILTFQGERISCDLETLDANPDGIIGVLKATASQCLERDKWMIVGGHYRSKGNVGAAAAVISAMVEVMLSPSVGLALQDLKPAFLMLSSCYMDLVKQTRASDGTDTAESREHARKATECLQQVYGVNVPPVQATSEYAPSKSSMDVSTLVVESEASRSRGYLANTSNLPAAERREPIDPEHHRENAALQPQSSSHIQMLEREIQALRDQQANNVAYVSRARSAKRKLEDDLDEERRTRRKLERQLDEAGKELAGARRGENFALEQCRAEVESRRRAELSAGELRDEVASVRQEMKERLEECKQSERRARECFGKLGVLFLKAANGEVEGGVWKGAFAAERGQSASAGVKGDA
ncbi:hypothetical protein AcV5_003580 [Taiwanofungus camphoratus]|nr:hypothetical protein AcV5_003580 [Antrodia cinnamomea]